MQIVIDIPFNNMQEMCRWHTDCVCNLTSLEVDILAEAVRNGIVLPENHGRLIDVDKLEYTCNSDECGMLTGCNHCQYHIITEDEVDNAPIVIEADNEVSE